MEKGIIKKYMLSDGKVFDFGRGKNKTSKKRHRRIIKRKSKREFIRDFDKEF